MGTQTPSFWGNREPFKSLREEIDNVFDSFGKSLPVNLRAFAGAKFPVLDVAETADAVEVSAELPGVDEKDVELTVADRALTIKGEKKSEHESTQKDLHVVERSYGAFTRVVPLPFDPDPKSVEATFKNGVLKVHLPKPPEAKRSAEKISIRTE